MKDKLTIALVAHDNRKADMVDWARYNTEYLSKQHLVCTGTTGGLIKKAFEEMGVTADVQCMNSGPMGGDAEIAAMVCVMKSTLLSSSSTTLTRSPTKLTYRCFCVSAVSIMCLSPATV